MRSENDDAHTATTTTTAATQGGIRHNIQSIKKLEEKESGVTEGYKVW